MKAWACFALLAAPAAVSAQSVVISFGTREEVKAGATVSFAAGGTLEVQGGGTLSIVGSSATSQAGFAGSSMGAHMNVSGFLELKFARLQNLTTLAFNGVLLHLRDVVFEDLNAINGPWLDLSAEGARDHLPCSLNRVTFIAAGGSRSNVKASLSTPLVRMLGNPSSHGNRWGEAHDDDPNDRVLWHSGAVSRSGGGTFDTIEEALKDPGTTAASTLTVTLGANAFIDELIDWNSNASASAAGPIVKNACIKQQSNGVVVWDTDGGTGRRGKLVNCVLAGRVDETSAENCTFYTPGGGVPDLSNVGATNSLIKSGYIDSGNNTLTNCLTVDSSFFAGAESYDFHLVSPGGDAAIDTGLTLSDLTDFDGQARGQDGKTSGDVNILWDIGADEFPDTLPPLIASVTSDTPNGYYPAGQSVQVKVKFTERVTLSGGNLRVPLNTGVVLLMTPFGPATETFANYVIAAGENADDLTVSENPLTLTGGTLRDTVNLDAVLTIPANQNLGNLKNIRVDTTPPTITSINGTLGDGPFNAGKNVGIRVNFSEPVVLTGNLQLSLNSGGTADVPPFGPADNGEGVYTVAAGENTNDLAVTNNPINLVGALTDLAGNPASLSFPADQNLSNNADIVIDTTPPTIVRITSDSENKPYGIGIPVDIKIVFSEPVTLANGPLQAALNTSAVVNVGVFELQTEGHGSYSPSEGENTTDLTAGSLTLGAGATLTDAAGNPIGSPGIPSGQNLADLKEIVIDTVRPGIATVTSTTPDGAYASGNINVTMTFTKPVELLTGNLKASLNSGGEAIVPPASGFSSSKSGTYTVQPGHFAEDLTADSPLLLLGGATLKDVAGNTALLTIPNGLNLGDLHDIRVDSVGPKIERITSTTPDGTYGPGTRVNVTVHFQEVAILSGGSLRVTLNNGIQLSIGELAATAASFTYLVAAGHPTVADLNVTSVALVGGATLKDSLGNVADLTLPASNNLADLKNIGIDTTRPYLISVDAPSTQNGTYGKDFPIDIILTFSEPVTLVSGTGGLILTLDSGGAVTVPNFTGSFVVATYTVLENHSSPDLTALPPLFLFGDATLKDVDGKDAYLTLPETQNLGNLKDIVIDTGRPSITSITSSSRNGTYGTGDAIDITVNFSEPVTLSLGRLRVTLDTGATVWIDEFGPASSASGTYVVGAGESSPDLDSMDLDLEFSGTTLLKDQLGLDAYLDIPLWGRLKHQKDIRVLSTPAGPLQPPTNVRTTAYNGVVDVEWDASPSAGVVGYNVYRRLSTEAWPPTPTPINTAVVVSLKYRDSGLSPTSTYVYRVTAVRP